MRTAFQFAWKMIKEKRHRAILLGGSTAVAAFLLFTSYFFIHSLHASIASVDGRLGADVIIVPKGMGSEASKNIVAGTKSYVYFDEKKTMNKLLEIKDITEIAPQLFLQTISTSCCGTTGDFPIVAFDPKKDFTLKSWMPGVQQLAKDEIVIGVNAGGDRFLYHYDNEVIKEKVMLFQKPFFVRNALFPTGTGADETIFMRLDTARELIGEIEALSHISKTAVSAIFIKTTPHAEEFVKQQIELGVSGVDVILGSSLRGQLERQIVPLKLLSFVMVGGALTLTLLQVITIFSALMRERQKEIGMLYALGVSKKRIYQLLLSEAAIVSFIGSFVGIIFSLSILYDRQTFLYMIFQLPLIFPNLLTTSIIGFSTMIILISCTIAAAFFPIKSFFSKEPYEIVREGDY